MITEQKNTVTRTYTYNDSQRLTSVTENSTTLGQYTYDALGRRTKKVAGEITTLYIYDQNGLLIEECSADGTWQKDYVYLNGQPLTMIVAGTQESVYYYHNDHLGTPQMMTDGTGTVVWAATYEPFGKATINVEQITNNLRFPGQYYDAETGLHYNYFRDYNAVIGLYVEADPVGIYYGRNHLYAYVANNPIIGIDFRGLKTYMCEKPLHALGGEGTRSGPDIWWNPLYHEYLCVGNPYVAITCFGQDRSGGPYSPGKPSNDTFNWYGCSEVVPDNKCLEGCIKLEGRKPRPYYGLIGPFTNCQEWAEGTLKKCKENCKCEK